MNRRQIVMDFRTARKLKGHKPCVILLKRNIGQIYNLGPADFIMSLGKDTLFFQRLTFFTKSLLPSKDFSLDLGLISSFHLREVGMVMNCLTLYTTDRRFIEIYYNTKTEDTYETEVNIKDMIKLLKERGIEEVSL